MKQYLSFVELINEGRNDEKISLLNSIYDSNSIFDSEIKDFDSPFEEEVFNDILNIEPENIELRNQVNVGGFLIDIALLR